MAAPSQGSRPRTDSGPRYGPAREEQERLATRLASLEAELAGLKGQAGAAAPAGQGDEAPKKPARARKKATGSGEPDVEAGAP